MIEKGVQRTIAFTMRDSTTGAPKTTLIAGDVTVKVSKDGAAFATATNSPVAIQDTGVNTGEFSLILTAAETTADVIVVKATAASCIEVRQKIVPEANYTAIKAGYLDAAISLTALDSTVAKEATLTAIKGAGWSNETLAEIYDAILTRLASKIYAGGRTATTVTVTDGTILEGDINKTKQINQQYLKVQETGKFKIDFEFTGLTQTEVCVCFVGKYFGVGSSNHKVEGKIWNYITSVWDDILDTERDFPHSNEDYLRTFTIPGTLSDYFSGVTPNITAKVRIEHVSNFNIEHRFWVDYIGLGAIEQIYMPPDNTTILSIDEAIDSTTYGLSALKTLVDNLQTDLGDPSTDITTIYAKIQALQTAVAAIPINPISVISATSGSVVVSAVKAGGTFQFVRGNEISYPYGPLGKDVTGRKIYFAVKKKAADSTYIIAFTEITGNLTNVATFTGLIPFTAAMTKDLAIGKYYLAINSYAADDTTFVKPLTEATFVLDLVDRIIDNP